MENLIPNKYKIFFWETLFGYSTNSENFKTKGAGYQSNCYHCHNHVEDYMHAFITCPKLEAIWHLAPFSFVNAVRHRF